MTLPEAIREQGIFVIACEVRGSQKMLDTARMAEEALLREQTRRPHNFDFEDYKLPGETQCLS